MGCIPVVFWLHSWSGGMGDPSAMLAGPSGCLSCANGAWAPANSSRMRTIEWTERPPEAYQMQIRHEPIIQQNTSLESILSRPDESFFGDVFLRGILPQWYWEWSGGLGSLPHFCGQMQATEGMWLNATTELTESVAMHSLLTVFCHLQMIDAIAANQCSTWDIGEMQRWARWHQIVLKSCKTLCTHISSH